MCWEVFRTEDPRNGQTLLMYAAQSNLAPIIETIIYYSYSSQHQDPEFINYRSSRTSMSALMLAAKLGYAEAFKALCKDTPISAGTDLPRPPVFIVKKADMFLLENDPANKHRPITTILMYAAMGGNVEIIKMIKSHVWRFGKYTNQKDADGMTALMYAAQNGHSTTVRFLLAHGANANLTNIRRQTAADLAEEASHHDLAKMLRRVTKTPTASSCIASDSGYVADDGGGDCYTPLAGSEEACAEQYRRSFQSDSSASAGSNDDVVIAEPIMAHASLKKS